MRADSFIRPTARHGTRACYVGGCRCEPCRGANAARYRERVSAMRELADTVKPTGPAIEGTLLRAGRTYRVRRCPGANGAPCIKGGAWLRGRHQVCGSCVERVTVWDGRVSPDRSRAHLLELRAAGVGYKAVSEACDISCSTLSEILAGTAGTIRAGTERRILAVDVGARADGARVPADRVNAVIADLRRRGFTLRHLGQLLGYGNNAVLQLGAFAYANAGTEARVERLLRRVERGEVVPRRHLVDAKAERAWLAEMMARGLTAKWLTQRLGFVVTRKGSASKMLPKNRDAVRRLRDELDTLRREGMDRPEAWGDAAGALFRLSQGFGFDGGWMVRGGTNGKSGKRLRKQVDTEVRAAKRTQKRAAGGRS